MLPILLGTVASSVLKSDFELIQTTLITTNTASVTFSDLNTYSQYKHLQLRITARGSQTDAATGGNIRFNGDTASNYYRHRIGLNDANNAILSSASSSSTTIGIPNFVPAAGNTTGVYNAAIIDILDFSSNNKTPTVRLFYGYAGEGAGTNARELTLSSGHWNSTASITSIFMNLNNGDFVTGSRFSLYGIKG